MNLVDILSSEPTRTTDDFVQPTETNAVSSEPTRTTDDFVQPTETNADKPTQCNETTQYAYTVMEEGPQQSLDNPFTLTNAQVEEVLKGLEETFTDAEVEELLRGLGETPASGESDGVLPSHPIDDEMNAGVRFMR